MKRKSIILILVLISFTTYAQNIAKDSILKIGFYKNIHELIDNTPSSAFNYEITEKKTSTGFLGDKITLYNLSVEKDSAKIIGDIFSFSDGQYIYLKTVRTGAFSNFKSNRFSDKSNFIKVINVGVYSFFYDLKNVHTYMPMYGGGAIGTGISVGISPSNKSYLPHILNSKTREIIALNTKQMKKLLADDPDLLKEFNADKNRKKNFEKYIVEYNKRFRTK